MTGNAPDGGSRRPLTKKQKAVLTVFAISGPDEPISEGQIVDDLYPVVASGRAARLVANHMVERGLIRLGDWYDDVGYELHLTAAGRKELEALDA